MVRASARPPAKYAPSADFRRWIQKFEIYLCEADVPTDKKARELVYLELLVSTDGSQPTEHI